MNNHIEGLPSVEETSSLLKEAEKLNQGPWVGHSIYSGRAAEIKDRNEVAL